MVYTRAQLESAETHDPYWNAAMKEVQPLVEALEFYADPREWAKDRAEGYFSNSQPRPFGLAAREALAKFRGEDEV